MKRKEPMQRTISHIHSSIMVLFAFFLLIADSFAESKIMLGVDYLEARNFDLLKGKRVGLLTHPAGVNSRGKRISSL